MEKRGEIILYQPDSEVRLEVRLEEETVWLTQAQIVELFQSSKANISEHIKNIYEQGELDESSTVRDFRTVRQEGRRYVERVLTYYNLDAIISIGFRVNSKRGIQFRQWANNVLKEYLLKGHAVNYRLDQMDTRLQKHERQIECLTDKVDFFVRTAIDLIRSAKVSLLLIDNYVDESVLLMLSKRNAGVKADIYTQAVSHQLQLDVQKHNSQYPPIGVHTYKKCHDRFLIIDGTDVWHQEDVRLLPAGHPGHSHHRPAVSSCFYGSGNAVRKSLLTFAGHNVKLAGDGKN